MFDIFFYVFENLVYFILFIFLEHLAFSKVKLYLNIAWRVRPFDIPKEVKIFQINSRMTRAVN